MSIHTILFDLDGTLIDTNDLIIASFRHTFKQYGKDLSRAEAIEFIGPPLRDTFYQFNPEETDEMMKIYRQHNLAHHDDYVTSFPQVWETLVELKKQDVQLGVVTTKMRQTTDMGLKITGLDSFFDVVMTLDDVTNAKPDSEPVIKAMNAFGANADTTLMVGDNSHDIEAGQNAGVSTAAVAWSLKGREKLLTYNPTYMLDDMRDLLAVKKV